MNFKRKKNIFKLSNGIMLYTRMINYSYNVEKAKIKLSLFQLNVYNSKIEHDA